MPGPLSTVDPRLRQAAALGLVNSAMAAALGGVWLAGGAGLVRAAAVPVALAMFAGPSLGEHGREKLGPANALTLGRAALVGWGAALIGAPHGELAAWGLLALNAVAFGLDGLDGKVARATGYSSAFGARLDMELDSITILVLCAQVWDLGQAGPWVFASGLMRYAFVAATWVWPWMGRELFGTRRRAWVCGVQVMCLLGALVLPGSELLAAAGLLALSWSFAVDVAWLVARRHDPC